MQVIVTRWSVWLTFGHHAIVLNRLYGFVGTVDPTGLLHRLINW